MVLKVAPLLIAGETKLNYCVELLRSVVETMHSSSVFWMEALDPGRRAMSAR